MRDTPSAATGTERLTVSGDGRAGSSRRRDRARFDLPESSVARATDSTRCYECLGCGQCCETFLEDCSDCGETAFATAVETPDTASVTDASVGGLAALVARLHPSVPR